MAMATSVLLLECGTGCVRLSPRERQNVAGSGDMATSGPRRQGTMCGNCDRPAPRLVPLVRSTRRGDRIDLRVCPFCYLQLAPDAKPRRIPR